MKEERKLNVIYLIIFYILIFCYYVYTQPVRSEPKATILKLTHPNWGKCLNCELPWKYINPHFVRLNDSVHSVYYMCEECWKESTIETKIKLSKQAYNNMMEFEPEFSYDDVEEALYLDAMINDNKFISKEKVIGTDYYLNTEIYKLINRDYKEGNGEPKYEVASNFWLSESEGVSVKKIKIEYKKVFEKDLDKVLKDIWNEKDSLRIKANACK